MPLRGMPETTGMALGLSGINGITASTMPWVIDYKYTSNTKGLSTIEPQPSAQRSPTGGLIHQVGNLQWLQCACLHLHTWV
jgi:hypothetical protein